MPTLYVATRDGVDLAVESKPGLSIMEIIRDSGADGLLALCGGACACGTCHVYVDEAFVNKLPAMGDDENALLDSSTQRTSSSRLSCQLRFTAELDGLRVQIAPED